MTDPAPVLPVTIAALVENELVVKKSRFIALVAPVSSPEDADRVIAEVLDRAVLVDRCTLAQATIAVPHADAGRFDNLLREWITAHGAVLGETAYAAEALFEVWAPDAVLRALAAEVASASSGGLAAVVTGRTNVVDVPRSAARDDASGGQEGEVSRYPTPRTVSIRSAPSFCRR